MITDGMDKCPKCGKLIFVSQQHICGAVFDEHEEVKAIRPRTVAEIIEYERQVMELADSIVFEEEYIDVAVKK